MKQTSESGMKNFCKSKSRRLFWRKQTSVFMMLCLKAYLPMGWAYGLWSNPILIVFLAIMILQSRIAIGRHSFDDNPNPSWNSRAWSNVLRVVRIPSLRVHPTFVFMIMTVSIRFHLFSCWNPEFRFMNWISRFVDKHHLYLLPSMHGFEIVELYRQDV